VFALDTKLRGFPVTRDQVVAVYQSSNAPHLAIPGKRAGLAQAYVIGLRLGGGLAVYVYLYLQEGFDCAVYSSNNVNQSSDEYRNEESEAFAFVESMGFIMTSINFRELSAQDQEVMLRTLPPFLKDPRLTAQLAAKTKAEKPSPAALLGRIFSSF
jgi:hypothetical protein